MGELLGRPEIAWEEDDQLKMSAISEEKLALLNICFSQQSLQAKESRLGKVRMGYMTFLKEFL